jgi:hypothetical protein
MKKIVLVNVDFIDAYTGELHKAGSRVEMTNERIAEVKAVIPEGVSIVGKVEEPVQEGSTDEKVEEPVPAEKPKKGKKTE